MPSNHTRGALALALGLALLAPGCVTLLEGEQPEDPTQQSYVLRANSTQEAPHPITFDGGYGALSFEGAARTVEPAGPVQASSWVRVGTDHSSQPDPSGAESDGPDAAPSPLGALSLQGVHGQFIPTDAPAVNLTGAAIQISLTRMDVSLGNVTGIRSTSWSFEQGEVHVEAPPGPPPLAAVGNTSTGNQSDDGGQGASEPLGIYPSLTIGPPGTTVTANVAILSTTNEDGSQPPLSHGTWEQGRLDLEPGTYRFGGAVLSVPVDGGFDLGPSEPVHLLSIERPTDPLLLYQRPQQPRQVDLTTVGVSGQISPTEDSASFQADTIQWIEQGRPRFEARTHASFVDHGETAHLEVRAGENKTIWIAVEETSRVGTAERVEPNVIDPRPDENGLTVSTGLTWYEHPDPGALEEIIAAIGGALTAWFSDPDETTIDPGQSQYLPAIVHAPEDAPPGEHQVHLDMKGDNARSNRITLDVTVT